MDGKTFHHILTRDPLNLCIQFFGGIFSLDTFPENPKEGRYYLINLSLSSEDLGSHWVIVNMIRRNSFEVLDSLAHDPNIHYPRLMRIGKELTKKVYCFPRACQQSWSSSCGLFCLYYSFFISRNYTGKEILNFFFPPLKADQLYLNDISISIFLRIIFKLRNLEKYILDLSFIEERHSLDKKQQKQE